jgi:hypothetical protein
LTAPILAGPPGPQPLLPQGRHRPQRGCSSRCCY